MHVYPRWPLTLYKICPSDRSVSKIKDGLHSRTCLFSIRTSLTASATAHLTSISEHSSCIPNSGEEKGEKGTQAVFLTGKPLFLIEPNTDAAPSSNFHWLMILPRLKPQCRSATAIRTGSRLVLAEIAYIREGK